MTTLASTVTTGLSTNPVLATLADAIAILNPADVIVDANPACERLLGRDRDSLIGHGFAELIVPPDFRGSHRVGLERIASGDLGTDPIRQDLFAVAADGRSLMLEVTFTPLQVSGQPLVSVQLRDISAERDILEQLSRSDEGNRALVEYSGTVVTVLNSDGSWRSSSRHGTLLLGYEKGFDPYGGILSLVHPEDLPIALEALVEVKSGIRGADSPVELRVRAADGSWKIFETAGVNLLDNPAVNGIVLHSKDVTADREAAQHLLSATSRMESLITSLWFAVLVEDEHRDIVLTNQAFTDLFQWDESPDELIGQNCTSKTRFKYLFADPAGFIAGAQRCMDSGVPEHGREMALADGRVVERDFIPIDVDGTKLGHLWIYRDITDRKLEERRMEAMIEEKTRSLIATQEELRAKSEFLTSVLGAMDSAVFVTDRESVIIALGGSAARLLGRPESELVGAPLSDFVEGAASVVLGSNEGFQQEMAVKRPTGKAVSALVVASPMHGDDGEPIGLVCVATDLTERKHLENELRQAQKMESVGQLAAGVAHEINTPVQFIGDSTRFLGDVLADLIELVDQYRPFRLAAAEVDPALAEMGATIGQLEDDIDLELLRAEAPAAVERTIGGVTRVSKIVAALKQFAHPGQGTLTATDINEIIETTLVVAASEYRYVADVETDLATLPKLVADSGDLSQVILNLVVNAAHAVADRGEERGRISIRSFEEDGQIVVQISDTGIGIPEHLRNRIFDPFFTTKAVGRGTGQGLAIVRSIVVERHGGNIDIVSEPGEGTTFTVRFPITEPKWAV